MYLLQTPARSNTKMGRLGYGVAPLLPFLKRDPVPQPPMMLVKLAGVGYGYQPRLGSSTNQPWRMGRMGMQPVRLPNLGRLGATAQSGPGCYYYGPDGFTIESVDTQSDVTECTVNGGLWNGPPALNTPTVPIGSQNPSPVAGGASNGGITTVPATTPSKSPLDYTSPQAAIAAGLDPQTVYNAWTAALARFPSPQAAISAGVPAGVVNQLWQSAHVNAAATPKPTSFFDSLNLGTVAMVGGGLLLLTVLRGGKRR